VRVPRLRVLVADYSRHVEQSEPHHVEPFRCPSPSCGATYRSPSSLDKHIKSHAATRFVSTSGRSRFADHTVRLRGPEGQGNITYGESMLLCTELILSICRVYCRLEQVILVALRSGTVTSFSCPFAQLAQPSSQFGASTVLFPLDPVPNAPPCPTPVFSSIASPADARVGEKGRQVSSLSWASTPRRRRGTWRTLSPAIRAPECSQQLLMGRGAHQPRVSHALLRYRDPPDARQVLRLSLHGRQGGHWPGRGDLDSLAEW
jgi:hypothetical protein